MSANDCKNKIYTPSFKGIVNGQRKQVSDTTIPPYNSVVHVPATSTGGVPAASGSVVGKNAILTSAHVADNVEIGAILTPAMNNGEAPYGTFRVSSISMPPEWVIRSDISYDYAIIAVEPNADGVSIGDLVPLLTIRRTNVSDLSIGEPVNVIGYPGDKGSEQMWESPGKLLRDDGKYYCLTDDLNWQGYVMAFSSDAVHGNSGGPVLNASNEIIGVLNLMSENVPASCDGETGGNGAPMMSDLALGWIYNAINETL